MITCNWIYYVVALAIIVFVALFIKKVTSCMMKLALFFILLVILCVSYYLLSCRNVFV